MAVTVVRQHKLEAKLRDPAFAQLWSRSKSPGGVAGELDISRDAVYDLIKRGRLDAIRLVTLTGRLLALVVPNESVERYRATRYQRQEKRA